MQKILIVDDDRRKVALFENYLQSENYVILKAFSGKEAISLARLESPDLILTDINLSDINGIELCRKIKNSDDLKLIPVIILSSIRDLREKRSCYDAGADDFIAKPFEPWELQARVKSFLKMKKLSEDARAYEKEIEIQKMRRHEERRIRDAYREAIKAVTSGKLELMEPEELEKYREEGIFICSMDIENPEDVGKSRLMVDELARSLGMEEEAIHSLTLCISEAITNTLKHAGTGKLWICRVNDKIRAWVEDKGPGIDFANITKSTLMKGYSTKPSLGYGFTIILELMDRIFLSTNPGGTTVVMEMNIKKKPFKDEIDEFLAAWKEL